MMPFPVDNIYIQKAEEELAVRFPQAFRTGMAAVNGGEVELHGDCWRLFPVRDSSSRKRLCRTCNDIVLETGSARDWVGFPADAIAIADNGSGDKLVMVRENSDKGRLQDTVYFWDHETGELHIACPSIAVLISKREQ
ncbi:MAG: SMI1/KNR4 family protein [Planctomycetota bacterium]|jgi:hypothetical protein